MKRKTEGTKLRAVREADLKRRDQATLRELGLRLKRANVERAHAYKAIAHYCRLGRQNVTARVQQLRAETRAAINAKAERLRAAQREQCAASQKAAREELDQVVAAARGELERAERMHSNFYGKKKTRTTALERRQEDDDEVARNLPPELVPVFLEVKRTIKAGPRRTRTEAFLEWAEANPDVVHQIIYAQAEADVARLISEQNRIKGRLRKGRKAYDDPSELAHALAGVPF
jgi:hypothetical protein